jgi:hypothetical protein
LQYGKYYVPKNLKKSPYEAKWYDAKSACNSLGGRLVVIDSKEKNEEVDYVRYAPAMSDPEDFCL